jgi:hypothetical protein
MTKLNPENSTISVHGRAALRLPYSRWQLVNGVKTQVDISASTLYIEIPAVHLRVALVSNPSDVKGLLIRLTRSQVETLPTSPVPFVIIDETVDPDVEWEGRIYRTGYIGDPTQP